MVNYIPVIAAVVAFIVTAALGFPFIPYLKKLKYGQTILEDGPKWHKSKEGTPTMGGIMMVAGSLVGIALSITLYVTLSPNFAFDKQTIVYIAGVVFSLLCCVIGLLDDYIKVVKKRNLGLTAKQKTAMQLFATLAYLLTLAFAGVNETWIPFMKENLDITKGFGLIFWPVSFVFIYFMVNAVNLTDGIDGLASSVTMVAACAFMLICTATPFSLISSFAAIIAGTCVGFVLWNAKPAKVFMGDTGSMFLGGAIVSLGFGCEKPILLLPIGIVYIAEALSVVLQVASFKLTGKRIFKMSPIHHHFEMSGWSEDKICLIFTAVTILGCIPAVVVAYFL